MMLTLTQNTTPLGIIVPFCFKATRTNTSKGKCKTVGNERIKGKID